VAPKRRAPQSELGATLRERFARNVRRLRRERGMTQEQLARAADIGRPFISRIENGRFSVTLETIGALAKALRTSPADLIAIYA
jgi:transcriptional regulator with XRE-family HTH domain